MPHPAFAQDRLYSRYLGGGRYCAAGKKGTGGDGLVSYPDTAPDRGYAADSADADGPGSSGTLDRAAIYELFAKEYGFSKDLILQTFTRLQIWLYLDKYNERIDRENAAANPDRQAGQRAEGGGWKIPPKLSTQADFIKMFKPHGGAGAEQKMAIPEHIWKAHLAEQEKKKQAAAPELVQDLSTQDLSTQDLSAQDESTQAAISPTQE